MSFDFIATNESTIPNRASSIYANEFLEWSSAQRTFANVHRYAAANAGATVEFSDFRLRTRNQNTLMEWTLTWSIRVRANSTENDELDPAFGKVIYLSAHLSRETFIP